MRGIVATVLIAALAGGPAEAQVGKKKSAGPLDLEFLKPRGPAAPPALGPTLKGQVRDLGEEQPLEFPLEREHGPALLSVATYVGKERSRLANQLARELRERHGLRAYVWRHQEQGEEIYRELSREEKDAYYKQFLRMPRTKKYQVPPAVHYAVLVGDFKALDDKMLDRVKAKLLALGQEAFPPDLRENLRWGIPEDSRTKRPQLMGVRGVLNPGRVKDGRMHLPPADLALLRKLNSEPTSVYHNAGRYTLRLFHFQGLAELIHDDDPKPNAGKAPAVDNLTIAAENAAKICKYLRGLGIDARTYHDLRSSAVCVGAYNQRDDPRLEQDLRKAAALAVGALKANPEPFELPPLFDGPLQGN